MTVHTMTATAESPPARCYDHGASMVIYNTTFADSLAI